MFHKKEFITKLTSLPSRGAASESERLAARYISEELNTLGLNVSAEEFKTPTRMPLIHFIHFFLIFLASIAANFTPLLSTIVGSLVVLSFWGEFTHRFFILRHLIPHATSQNVIGKIGSDAAKAKVVISAHMDAARAGVIFHPIFSHGAGRFKKLPLHKSLLIAMIALLAVFVVKAFGGGTWVLSIVFNTIAVITLIASLLMLQWEMSPFSLGANDDLSAVAVMLGLAEKLKNIRYNDFQFIFVATGAEEAHCSGMKAYMKRHKHEHDKESSYFINLECLGGGKIKYVTREGFIIFQEHDHTLIQIADIVARKYKIDFKPTYTVAHSESIVPLTLGFKSLGIIAMNEYNVPTNYHQKSDIEANIDYNLLETAQETLLRMVDTLKEFKHLGYL